MAGGTWHHLLCIFRTRLFPQAPELTESRAHMGHWVPSKSFGIISLKYFQQDRQLFSHPSLSEVNGESTGSSAFSFICVQGPLPTCHFLCVTWLVSAVWSKSMLCCVSSVPSEMVSTWRVSSLFPLQCLVEGVHWVNPLRIRLNPCTRGYVSKGLSPGGGSQPWPSFLVNGCHPWESGDSDSALKAPSCQRKKENFNIENNIFKWYWVVHRYSGKAGIGPETGRNKGSRTARHSLNQSIPSSMFTRAL